MQNLIENYIILSIAMKVYQELNIAASTEELVALLNLWKNSHNLGWEYDRLRTMDYAKNTFSAEDKTACFHVNEEGLEEAFLWLYIDKNGLRVTNIIPLKIVHLNFDEYNNILKRFYDVFVIPHKDNRNYKITLTRAYPNINDLANKATAQKLTLWEKTCNHDNGNLHTLDEEKWFDFVITAAQTKSPLERDELKRWLIEEKNWIDDGKLVDRLCDEYENETRLLLYFFSNYA